MNYDNLRDINKRKITLGAHNVGNSNTDQQSKRAKITNKRTVANNSKKTKTPMRKKTGKEVEDRERESDFDDNDVQINAPSDDIGLSENDETPIVSAKRKTADRDKLSKRKDKVTNNDSGENNENQFKERRFSFEDFADLFLKDDAFSDKLMELKKN